MAASRADDVLIQEAACQRDQTPTVPMNLAVLQEVT